MIMNLNSEYQFLLERDMSHSVCPLPNPTGCKASCAVTMVTCVEELRQWFKGKKSFRFAVPMIWREPKNHSDDCYFCSCSEQGFNLKNRKDISYPTIIRSDIRPVPDGTDLPIPSPPDTLDNILDDLDQISHITATVMMATIQFVKALDKEGECFKYLCEQFPGLSDAKLKEGISVRPDIIKHLKDETFVTKMEMKEKNAWN
ncbi:uncharacterized protein TNCV_3700201 [Trichonephila clavipes]|nr:uncharacterized protein TNCV_3700201 [Trichonephila clavipes]